MFVLLLCEKIQILNSFETNWQEKVPPIFI